MFPCAEILLKAFCYLLAKFLDPARTLPRARAAHFGYGVLPRPHGPFLPTDSATVCVNSSVCLFGFDLSLLFFCVEFYPFPYKLRALAAQERQPLRRQRA